MFFTLQNMFRCDPHLRQLQKVLEKIFILPLSSCCNTATKQLNSTHNTNQHCRVRFYSFVGQPLSKYLYIRRDVFTDACIKMSTSFADATNFTVCTRNILRVNEALWGQDPSLLKRFLNLKVINTNLT